MKEVMRQLPREHIIYFGDTARAPYGPRSSKEVTSFTMQIVTYLLQFDPKMIVIACNTATAVAIDEVRAKVRVPVLGVIMPGARAAIERTRNGHIGVIGTEGTILSGAYEEALRRISPGVRVVSMACPSFVPLVERGIYRTKEAKQNVCDTLRGLKQESIDTLILGCTHYPFLADTIRECTGGDIWLISSADQTARDVSTLLSHSGQLETSLDHPKYRYFCSGDPNLFQRIAQEWLEREVEVTPFMWQVPKLI